MVAAPVPIHQRGRAQDAGRVHVLVVDDYADNVASMAMLLRLYGHAVDTALSGRDAIQKAQTQAPDVVLLDISMPGMDGYSVAKQLRSLFRDRVRLIALTAYSSQQDHHRCLQAGFDVHLIKPADPEEVQRLVEQAADRLRRSQRG